MNMPVYNYSCPACHRSQDVVSTVAERDRTYSCPCGKGTMQRDVIASLRGTHSTDQEYAKPIYSEALGVHPSQVTDAQRRNPNHEFTPDGRMIFRSHAQRNRIMKELGYHDRDGY